MLVPVMAVMMIWLIYSMLSVISLPALVTSADFSIQRVIEALKLKGMYENSVIMFASDVRFFNLCLLMF